MKINQAFCHNDYKGDVGLELEVEGRKVLPGAVAPWFVKAEGSLRGHAVEYYTHPNYPIKVNEIKIQQIRLLTDGFEPKYILHDSPRTSLHVHVNMQQADVNKVYTAACTYWLMENLLTKFCGEEREGNHFCLRMTDAETLLKMMCNDARRKNMFHSFANHGEERELRYAALNFCSLGRFGSLEFRGMRGTIDPYLIDMWSTEVYNLCKKSQHFLPNDLMDFYFRTPKLDFLLYFFGKNFVTNLVGIKHWEELIEENEGSVCELAYLLDWKNHIYEKEKTGKKTVMHRDVEGMIARHAEMAIHDLDDLVDDDGWADIQIGAEHAMEMERELREEVPPIPAQWFHPPEPPEEENPE